MIYLVTLANYMCVEVDSKVGEPKYPQLPTFLNILMVINTFIYYTFQHIYAVFIATYAVSSILNTFLLVYVVHWKNTGGKMGKKIFKGTVIGYLIIAFPIWLVDMHCCDWVLTNVADNMHGLTLHVVWHLCAGYGAYCVLVTLEYCRMIALKIPCTCDFWLGFIPITRRLLPKDENWSLNHAYVCWSYDFRVRAYQIDPFGASFWWKWIFSEEPISEVCLDCNWWDFFALWSLVGVDDSWREGLAVGLIIIIRTFKMPWFNDLATHHT